MVAGFQAQASPFGIGGGIAHRRRHNALEVHRVRRRAWREPAPDRLTYEAGRRREDRLPTSAESRSGPSRATLAAGEINQILKQLRAAQIREAIAEREWTTTRQQIKHAEEIEHFFKGEETRRRPSKKDHNQAFYTWMKREVKGLYSQCFQFAFDVAKKAERALQHELGDPRPSFIQFSYMAGKEGLLAGERLYLDIKRMEMAYHELNQREYELTKHVSLLQVDPRRCSSCARPGAARSPSPRSCSTWTARAITSAASGPWRSASRASPGLIPA